MSDNNLWDKLIESAKEVLAHAKGELKLKEIKLIGCKFCGEDNPCGNEHCPWRNND